MKKQRIEPIAIVGIGCRLPGNVSTPEGLWELLISKGSGITEIPANRWAPDFYYHKDNKAAGKVCTRWGGFVENLDGFDAAFFGISPREARRMDPQQRWMLEVTWEAIEDSGIPPSKLRGKQVGVFVGISSSDYSHLQHKDLNQIDVHSPTGLTLSIASNRISYLFDFKGPSLSIDTACSSSLVAFNQACQSIWSGSGSGSSRRAF